MPKIPIVLSETMLQSGYRQYIQWDTDLMPHCAVCGTTGSGKSYLMKLLCAKVSKHIPNSHLFICDYKGDSKDFGSLWGCKNYFRFDEYMNGLNFFHSKFLEVQKIGENKDFHMILLSEWASFVDSLDKKEAEKAKKQLSVLLRLARSYNFHVALDFQRLDSEYFSKSRDCIGLVICLGNQSKENISMIFSDFRDFITNDRSRGTGYIIQNQTDVEKIIVPEIGSMSEVEKAIKQAVTR